VISKPDKNKLRLKRHKRIRGKISGTAERPRLSVFRSNKNIYAQLIDDVEGVTLASASSMDDSANKTKTEQAEEVGKKLAEAAAKKNIKNVVFDRSGYLYHGRVAALAESARKNGLEF
jgi:large subunit ribosomal protein L18